MSQVSDQIRNEPFKGFQIEGYEDSLTLLMKVGETVVEFRLNFIPEKSLRTYDHQIEVSIKDDKDKWL